VTKLLQRGYIICFTCSFLAGVVSVIVVPEMIRTVVSHTIFPITRTETSRITSPDGAVDAVMSKTECGAPCSTGYSVYIVPRGSNVSSDAKRVLFSADDMVDDRLLWKQPHLLEIAYDKALINSFRNVAYPFGEAGKQESWRYAVEIRLAPNSEGFSYLKESSPR
jgi:hypothetical protein